MFDIKSVRVPLTLKDGQEGNLQAVFSVFNEVDSDGDVVLASAFQDGQAVPLVWSHKWDMPVGKGVIRVEPNRAIFDGQFFIDTAAGKDAYLTVKNMGDLQEYSWGFRVLDSSFGELDGKQVRYIQRAEVFEVSPTLVGANRNTHTLAIKAGGVEAKDAGPVYPVGSRVAPAIDPPHMPGQGAGEVREAVLTYAYGIVFDGMEADGIHKWYVESELAAVGASAMAPMAPMKGARRGNETFDDQDARLLRDLEDYRARAQALAATRAKEGRAISTARRERLGKTAGVLRTIADDLEALLAETAPPEKGAGIALLKDFIALEARLNGVAIPSTQESAA